MSFDWTINIGGVAAFAAIIVTLVGLHTANVRRITAMETKLDMLYQWWTRER